MAKLRLPPGLARKPRLDGRVVPGCGPVPCDVMLVGEAPGKEEAARGQPFVGKSGREQDMYFAREGLSPRYFYRTNVYKVYQEGNPDATPAQIAEATQDLLDEVAMVGPELIIAVGRFAARFFLGEEADLERTHGLPHDAGAFDPLRKDRAGGAIVVPVHHPALGFYDADARGVIAWDYQQAASIYYRIQKGLAVETVGDRYPNVEYLDMHPDDLLAALEPYRGGALGVDTEGEPGTVWSIQISPEPAVSWVLRTRQAWVGSGSRPESDSSRDPGHDLSRALQKLCSPSNDCLSSSTSTDLRASDFTWVLHNALFDIPMLREAGLDLTGCRVWDTMYAAYLMRLEPQGLKPLAWRWCGVRMRSYRDTVGNAGEQKQLDYLGRALETEWPKPEGQVTLQNDGTLKLYRPQNANRRIDRILSDWMLKDDVDLRKRWRDIDEVIRGPVEAELGPMPTGTLDDIPLDEAIEYSARDADITRRLYDILGRELRRRGMNDLMENSVEVLPIFEEMQSKGFPASRRYFEALAEEMTSEMVAIQADLSSDFNDGEPLNPASSPQVAALLKKLKVRSLKKTPKGAISTGKKALEHLRYKEDAIGLLFDWRERQKIRDGFCKPILRAIPPDVDVAPVHATIKTTRVHTRRLATAEPNLLAIPARTELGLRVREGFQAPDGFLFGAWDLSQIELRVAAHLSQDPLMCRQYRQGADIHSETAARVFQVAFEDVDKQLHRTPAKSAGFGILYGITGGGLVDALRVMGCEGWTEDSCNDLIASWLDVYSGIKAWIEKVKAKTKKTGEVRDIWGMVRYLPGIWSSNRKDIAEAGRTAVSHTVQGSAQGMLQRSMAYLAPQIRELQGAGYGVQWVLQVHDELVFMFEEDLAEYMDEIVVDALTNHCGVRLSVPVEASGAVAKTWAGLK